VAVLAFRDMEKIFKRKKKIIGFAGALIISSSLFLPSSATADPFGTYTFDTGPKADGANHTWCEYRVNWIPSWFDPFDDAMSYLDSHTDMTTNRVYPCTEDTDILFSVRDSEVLGSNTRGVSFCVDLNAATLVCNSSHVQLNSDLLLTYTQRRKTSCHEIGHTVGLSHAPTGDDCMISGNYGYAGYNPHHTLHINIAY
jgi:hypothetical protein